MSPRRSNEQIGLTGIVLTPHRRRCTRRRGVVDARGHRKPIKLLGVGEQLNALEAFQP